jgi:hypothetical protein
LYEASLDQKAFLKLPTEEIVKIVQQEGCPKVGVFVPDGNRRFTLKQTDAQPNTVDFYSQLALIQTKYGLETLKVFFSHGLSVLFTPIFSRAVLERDPLYRFHTARKTLEIMFTGGEWLNFYRERNVRVRIYGDLDSLNLPEYLGTKAWIEQIQEQTVHHDGHDLYIGIGGEPWVGWDAVVGAIRFHEKYRRQPMVKEEIIDFIYEKALPPADFVILSGKPGGLGALPALICGKNTHLYYLPAPGVAALTQSAFRAILYDLIFIRKHGYEVSPEERERLRDWYQTHSEIVIGLGQNIGPVWLPDLDCSKPE